MKKKLLCGAAALCLMLGLTACKEEIRETLATTAPVIAEITEPAAETTIAPTEPESVLLDRSVDGKVCVGIVPTEVGSWRYAVIEDQEAAVAAFEKATGAIYSDEWWIKGDKTVGLTVEYNGEIWEFVDSGELCYALGRVKAEDAADLYALCAETAWEAGWQEGGVKPEQITDLTCAVLRQGDRKVTLTDPAALDALEGMLAAGKFALGGFGCPFAALLDLEREDGELLTIALAVDGCGAWMSEGNYYDFGNDSQPLFDLFGVRFDVGDMVVEE